MILEIIKYILLTFLQNNVGLHFNVYLIENVCRWYNLIKAKLMKL